MADDTTVLEVGVMVDQSNLETGMGSIVATVTSGTEKMAGDFQSLASAATTADAQIAAANNVIATDSAAQLSLFSAYIADASGQLLLFEETVGALPAQAVPAIEETSSVFNISLEGIGAGFAKLYETVSVSVAGINEAVSGMAAHIAESAEASNLSVGSIAGAFGGLSKLLGAGIVVGFAAHFLDEAAQVEVELGHLSEKTGIAVGSLSGLRAATQQFGAGFESVETSLVRVQRAQQLAIDGNQTMITGFQRLGISVQELKGLSPEDIFLRLAQAIAGTQTHQAAVISSMQLLGRGGAAIIPVFKQLTEAADQQGVSLQDYISTLGKSTGVTEDSVKAAEEWRKSTALLAQEFQADLIPVIGTVLSAIKDFKLGLAEARAAVGEFVITGVGLGENIKVLLDPTLSWSQTLKAIHDNSSLASDQIARLNKETGDYVKNLEGAEGANKDPFGIHALMDALGTPITPKVTLEADPESADKVAATEKAKLDARVASIDLWKAKQHAAYEDGKIDVLSWVQAQTSADSQALSAHEAYFSRLKSLYADDPQKLASTQQEKFQYESQTSAKTTDEYATEVEKLNHTLDEYVSKLEVSVETGKEAEEDLKSADGATIEYVKSTQSLIAAKQHLEEAQRSLNVSQQETSIKTQADLGLISKSDESEQLLALYRKEEADQLAHLQTMQQQAQQWAQEIQTALAGDPNNLVLKAQYDNALATLNGYEAQRLQIEKQFNNQISQLEIQRTQSIVAEYNRLTSSFNSAITGMITSQRTLLQASQQVFSQVVSDALSWVLKLGERWVLEHVVMAAASRLFNTQESAGNVAAQAQKTAAASAEVLTKKAVLAQELISTLATTTAETTAVTASQAAQTAAVVASQTAQTTAITAAKTAQSAAGAASAAATIAENFSIAQSDVATSAAIVFLEAIQNIPFPANIVAAPALAATTYSLGAPYVALAAFESGGVIPGLGPVPIIGHGKEMVLPEKISTGLQSLYQHGDTNNSSYQSNSSQENQNNQYGGSFHYHSHTDVSSWDSRDVGEFLSGHQDVLKDVLKKAVKSGTINPRELIR